MKVISYEKEKGKKTSGSHLERQGKGTSNDDCHPIYTQVLVLMETEIHLRFPSSVPDLRDSLYQVKRFTVIYVDRSSHIGRGENRQYMKSFYLLKKIYNWS